VAFSDGECVVSVSDGRHFFHGIDCLIVFVEMLHEYR
jgi:hypothetical protein